MSCQICGSTENLQLHHDSYEPEITRSLCVPCHQTQHEGHGVGLGVGWSSKHLNDNETFSELWDSGLTYQELMNRFGISYMTVYNWAARLNKPKRNEHSPNDHTLTCPKCGSEDTRKAGKVITVNGQKQRYQCKTCGKTFYHKYPKCGKCGYEWEPRVEEPKSCPRCKARLDTPIRKVCESKEEN